MHGYRHICSGHDYFTRALFPPLFGTCECRSEQNHTILSANSFSKSPDTVMKKTLVYLPGFASSENNQWKLLGNLIRFDLRFRLFGAQLRQKRCGITQSTNVPPPSPFGANLHGKVTKKCGPPRRRVGVGDGGGIYTSGGATEGTIRSCFK